PIVINLTIAHVARKDQQLRPAGRIFAALRRELAWRTEAHEGAVGMHPALLARHVAITRACADHPASDLAIGRTLDPAGADIGIRPAADSHRLAAEGLTKETRGRNPVGARLRNSAPKQRR